MNLIVIKGNLTKEPEPKTTQSGKSLATVTVAVARRFKKDVTDFFTVTAWDKTAEFLCQYFHKGNPILVTGEMQSRTYQDNNGVSHTVWEVLATQFDFCGGKPSEADLETAPKQVVQPQAQPQFTDITDQDLPF